MARMKGNRARGRLGNVIFYEMNDQAYARTQPGKVRQSEATKAWKQVFGSIKSISSHIRAGLAHLVPYYRSQSLMHQVDAQVRLWLKYVYPTLTETATEFPYLQEFSLNTEAPDLRLLLRGIPKLDWSDPTQVRIALPPLNAGLMAAPLRTRRIQLRFAITAVSLNPLDPIPIGALNFPPITLPYRNSLVTDAATDREYKLTPGHLHIVGAALRYDRGPEGMEQWVEDPAWQPAGVIGCCFVPAEPQKTAS